MKRIFTLLLLLAIAFSIEAQENFEQYLQLEDEYQELCLSDSTLVGYRFFYEKTSDTTYNYIDVFSPVYTFRLMEIGLSDAIYSDHRVQLSQNAFWSYIKQNKNIVLPEFPVYTLNHYITRRFTADGFRKFREEKEWLAQQKKDVQELKSIIE